MPIHAITKAISPLRILARINRTRAIIAIENRNNKESEYHDLPLQNFQIGNKIIEKEIIDTAA
jgi:hypothetical protein